ncbi:uncharacterized protein DNG_08020 [Cephalotrichum gorgonifer]|uniref:Aminoglycoside phosphotransferase domain-containing protein n=1 Tax=Cephalotrichum gorgonifer TaxID=2041049 RepID=A0AAE8N598_9PEZI|nr:uncharacterized protein DNG_08020 [Cephalotrichum gorgonifer]
MNELVTTTTYPPDQFPTAPFDRASDYFASLASDHFTHLRAQRNLAYFEETVRCRYIARHQFARLIPEYCLDDAGFLLFCDDMRPGNMLVDPETFRITAVLDLEFTNAVPAQFSYNPPWWLLLSSPCHWLDRGTFDEFLALYEPRMEQFLRALEHVEGEEGSTPPGLHDAVALSTRMRESWKTGRFWFDFMARKSLDIDVTYWTVMHEKHKDGSGGGSDDEQLLDYEVLLDNESRSEMELLVGVKMEQAKAYDEEHKVMFSKKE